MPAAAGKLEKDLTDHAQVLTAITHTERTPPLPRRTPSNQLTLELWHTRLVTSINRHSCMPSGVGQRHRQAEGGPDLPGGGDVHDARRGGARAQLLPRLGAARVMWVYHSTVLPAMVCVCLCVCV